MTILPFRGPELTGRAAGNKSSLRSLSPQKTNNFARAASPWAPYYRVRQPANETNPAQPLSIQFGKEATSIAVGYNTATLIQSHIIFTLGDSPHV
ncbi:hypothetical protein CGRA01v4_00268 [Colletotrichum graminicola]|nr:hypothetical protein CGRA01v4_00268 [Colletotrichum graminicola]